MEEKINVTLTGVTNTSVIDFAAAELDKYLKRIYPEDILRSKQFIFKLCQEGFRFDGYSVDEEGDSVTISSCCQRGILHGVYAFLRKLGCSFVFPLPQKQHVPKLSQWKSVTLRNEPYMEYRGICLYNTTKENLQRTLLAVDWMAKNGFNFILTSIHRLDDTGCCKHAIMWDEIEDALLPELEKRGIVIDMSEHSTDYYFPKEKLFKEHPDWFAQVDGKRQVGQICYSNKDAVNAFADSIASFVKDKPYFKFFGIWPLDGGGYCECENCKDSQTIFEANRVVAQKIYEVRPDLTVEHLAYTPQSFPRPKRPMPKNMSALVCHVRDNVAYEWSLAAQDCGGAFYFDYMTADHYRFRSNVIFNPEYCKDTVNALVSYNYRGVVSLYLPVDCYFQSSLNLYYMSQLYYNPVKSIEEITLDLAAELFGCDNAEEGAEILEFIAQKIFDKSLWSGYSFSHDWFKEHITNRNEALDSIHLEKFNKIASAILDDISYFEAQVEDMYKGNVKLLKQFVELSALYYNCVDSFNAQKDTPEKAEPYFEKLKQLNKEENSPFIDEEYARWRVTGRDNIFDASGENLYQV